jgi:hypothetical protein
MDGGNRGAIERGIKLAPFARRHDRAGGQPHRLQQMPITTGSAGNISPTSVTVGLSDDAVAGRLDRALLGLLRA